MQRPVEIDDLGKLRDEQRRRDPKRCADRTTDHDPQSAPLRNRGQRERLGQPARLVELDSDGLVFPVEPVEIGKRPAGFVSAERDRMLHPRQRVVSAGQQRLLYQFDPAIDERRHELAKLGLVNVASVRSVVAGGGNLQYDTTKAAVAGLTRGLAADHSAEGIRVNAVGPGPIFTPFHQRRIAASGETIEQYNARAAQGTMLKRPGRAEEVAAAILFLASDDASYVTGVLLFVDGGMTAL